MQQHLTYDSLEKIAIGKPVDRLSYMSAACSGKTVLDVGCFDERSPKKHSTEHWLHGRILQQATKVIGIDSSGKLPIAGIVTGPNGKILRRDASTLDLDGIDTEEIEVIVAGEFIEHLEHPMGFLREVKKKLPGRELIISTPNGACFSNNLVGMISREVQDPDHLQNFTFKTLNTMCLRVGFQSWEIIPYRFYATSMILDSSGFKKIFAQFVQIPIRWVERLFPLLSFGYIVKIRV